MLNYWFPFWVSVKARVIAGGHGPVSVPRNYSVPEFVVPKP